MEEQQWEELKALYGWSIDDLREFKSRQWQTAYYVLLLYSALGYIGYQYRSSADALVVQAILVAGALIMGCGWSVVVALEEAMELRRSRMADVAERFSQAFRDCRRPLDTRGKDETLSMFELVIVAAWGVLALYLLRIVPAIK